jgi:hypothetical protein
MSRPNERACCTCTRTSQLKGKQFDIMTYRYNNSKNGPSTVERSHDGVAAAIAQCRRARSARHTTSCRVPWQVLQPRRCNARARERASSDRNRVMGTACHVSRTICLDRENVCAWVLMFVNPDAVTGPLHARTCVGTDRTHHQNHSSHPHYELAQSRSGFADCWQCHGWLLAGSWPGNASAWRGGVVAISESACAWQQGHAAAGSGLTGCACLPVALLCCHLATCFQVVAVCPVGPCPCCLRVARAGSPLFSFPLVVSCVRDPSTPVTLMRNQAAALGLTTSARCLSVPISCRLISIARHPRSPVVSFGLGVWQVRRKAEKEALIEELKGRLSAPAINLPTDPADVAELDYQHVHVTGEYVAPRHVHLSTCIDGVRALC